MLIKTNDITVDEIRKFKSQNGFYLHYCNSITIKYYNYLDKYSNAFSMKLSQKERNKAYRELKQLVNEAKEYMSNEVV